MAANKAPSTISSAQPQRLAKRFEAEDIDIVDRKHILRRQPDEALRLSFAQERFWLLNQIQHESPAYVLPVFLRLKGSLNFAALEKALSEIARRHETLRTTFTVRNSSPLQVIASFAPLTLQIADLIATHPVALENALRQIIIDEARSLDLADGPLFRTKLFRLGAEDHALLIVMHHIISDGWSVGVICRELGKLYEAYCQNQPSPLSELSIQYADFALWQRRQMQGEVLGSQLSYWKRQLEGAPPMLALPLNHSRPAAQSYAGRKQTLVLGRQLATRLQEISREEHSTLYMTLLAAFAALLSRYTNETDISIGSPIAGRTRLELEALVGSFVNTLVLRVNCGGDPSFRQQLRRVREVCLGAYGHQEVPFEKVVEALEPERKLSHAPLFQVFFALQNMPQGKMRMGELEVESYDVDLGTSQFDLSLIMKESKSGLLGVASYNTDIFDPDTINYFCGHWETLLEGIARKPEARISELPMLTEAETRRLLFEWNPPDTQAVQTGCMQHLFEAQVKRTPEIIALAFGDEEISYQELNSRANRLAHYLRLQGVGLEERVGILLDRSPDMVVALLAVLKSGGAYVPIDAAYPKQRIALMLEDAGIRVLLTQKNLLEVLPLDRQAVIICLDEEEEEIARQPDDTPVNQSSAENLAYVIYTSGSTGKPKGVAIEHRSVIALLNWAKEYFTTEEMTGTLASTSICFDLSVFEIFAPLSSGGTVILVENVLSLIESTIRQPIKLINTVPSAISEVLRAKAIPATVCTVNLAGEPLPKQLVQQLYEETGVRQVWNLYGPSEDTTYSTAASIERGVNEKPPIGRPILQTQAYVLDRYYGLIPTGVTGELFLGGAGLARGYVHHPESTAERFVPHPFSRKAGARLYRTGDLARFLPNGEIDFQGRADFQIKLRGHRIELGEIETALRDHQAIKEAVVLVRGGSGDRRLIAYLVGSEAEALTTAELRQYLQLCLPSYMVPQFFVWLAEFPLTTNGKLDRQSLPDPDLTLNVNEQEDTRSPTPLESIVAAVWSEVLRVQRVDVTQNFFELGGHSLLGMQVTNQLKETLGVDLPLRALFEAPTVELLCRYLISNESIGRQGETLGSVFSSPNTDDSRNPDKRFPGDGDILPADLIKPVMRNGNLRMSIQQEAGLLSAQWGQFLVLSTALAARSKVFRKSAAGILGILARLNKRRRRKQGSGEKEALSPWINRSRAIIQGLIRSSANRLIPNAENSAGNKRRHVHMVSRWNGTLDVAALHAALNEIVRRHESLRTTFSIHNGRPIQNLLPVLKLSLDVVALDGMSQGEREAEAQKLLTEEIERSFDLAQGPLLRMTLLKLDEDEHIVCVVIHHFVCDGVSLDIFNHEIRVLYESFLRGAASPLPDLTIQFADFAHWQREWLKGEVLAKAMSFWNQHLEGVGLLPELELPFAGTRPTVTSYRGANETLQVPDQLAKSLKALSYQQKSTMYMLFLTALKVLLHHYTGKEYIGVMTPFANRIRPGTSAMIGWIQHTLILNTRIKGNPIFSELLAQMRDEFLRTYQYHEIPYSIMFSELLPRQRNHELLLKLPRLPYVFFDFETRKPPYEVPGLTISRMRSPITAATPGIAVRVIEYNGRMMMQITYEKDVYKAADVQQMLQQLILLLERIVGNADERIETLSRGL